MNDAQPQLVAAPAALSVQMRPMAPHDLSAVIEIERQAYEFPWTEGIFRDCLRVGYHCRVALRDDIVLGYGVMSLGAGECHLLNICVRPGYQAQGIGRYIITELLANARVNHVTMAFLEVRRSNTVAYRLYSGLGFDEVGVRKNYYPARRGREDALLLGRAL